VRTRSWTSWSNVSAARSRATGRHAAPPAPEKTRAAFEWEPDRWIEAVIGVVVVCFVLFGVLGLWATLAGWKMFT
jgi:hypothetical protein